MSNNKRAEFVNPVGFLQKLRTHCTRNCKKGCVSLLISLSVIVRQYLDSIMFYCSGALERFARQLATILRLWSFHLPPLPLRSIASYLTFKHHIRKANCARAQQATFHESSDLILLKVF